MVMVVVGSNANDGYAYINRDALLAIPYKQGIRALSVTSEFQLDEQVLSSIFTL